MDLELRSFIRDVPDFPRPGILFRDITPLLRDPEALRNVIERLRDRFAEREVAVVAGIESRGFIFGSALALELNAGFVPIRKLGKLPAETVGRAYALEYGEAHLEMHRDAVAAGTRVLLVDDLLATGGTAGAALELLRETGAEVVAAAFLIELTGLGGRARLPGVETVALLGY
jgi:adenine phosphoribosyltransferase